MDNVTIGQIVGVFGTITVLAGFFTGIYGFIKKIVLDKINKNAEDIKSLQQEVKILKIESTDSKEERLILLKAQLACLKGLKEQGCNGPVSQAIGDIEEYLLKKSHD